MLPQSMVTAADSETEYSLCACVLLLEYCYMWMLLQSLLSSTKFVVEVCEDVYNARRFWGYA